nr:sulfotransferase [Ornithinimicrobium sp. HY1793]
MDFSIVGAAKSGTSSLGRWLHEQPSLHVLQPKDSHYFFGQTGKHHWAGPRDEVFNKKILASREEMPAQLARVSSRVRVGEASAFYMADPATVTALERDLSPNGIAIAILRRPDERAFSAYMHMVREGLEPGSFEEGLLAEDQRIADGWQPIWWYRALGYYTQQVECLFDVLGRDRVHIMRYEDVVLDPVRALAPALAAIGTSITGGALTRQNAGGVPRNRALHRFLTEPRLVKRLGSKVVPRSTWSLVRSDLESRNLTRAKLPAHVRPALMADYLPDVRRLEGLTGLDLSTWNVAP